MKPPTALSNWKRRCGILLVLAVQDAVDSIPNVALAPH
jgi:hypothetical protein